MKIKEITTKWLFETIEEYNALQVPRLRALPGQVIFDRKKRKLVNVRTDLNVQSNSEPRINNPVGTVFESEILTIEKTITKPPIEYYSVGMSPLKVVKLGTGKITSKTR